MRPVVLIQEVLTSKKQKMTSSLKTNTPDKVHWRLRTKQSERTPENRNYSKLPSQQRTQWEKLMKKLALHLCPIQSFQSRDPAWITSNSKNLLHSCIFTEVISILIYNNNKMPIHLFKSKTGGKSLFAKISATTSTSDRC